MMNWKKSNQKCFFGGFRIVFRITHHSFPNTGSILCCVDEGQLWRDFAQQLYAVTHPRHLLRMDQKKSKDEVEQEVEEI